MADPSFAKLVVLVNGSLPLALLLLDARNDQLGPDPINAAIHVTGMTALIFILLTLSITPVRKLSGWNFLSHFRRMLGLFAFFYALIHFSTYFALEESFRVGGVVQDVLNGSAFIIYGLAALILLIPLALTSTNGMIKRLGAARWKRLHALVYPAAALAAIHFLNVGKVVSLTSKVFAAVLVILLLYRLLAQPLARLRKILVVKSAPQN